MPANTNVQVSRARAHSLSKAKPTARPINENAAQGKIGNNQACGVPRLCTPSMYDSKGQGSRDGRHAVHSNGVSREIRIPVLAAFQISKARDLRLNDITPQHSRPINIIESPIVLSTSTRSRSDQGAQGNAIRYSCRRNSNPSPKISAPRRIVVFAISFAGTSFLRSLSVTSANEMPARNRNN